MTPLIEKLMRIIEQKAFEIEKIRGAIEVLKELDGEQKPKPKPAAPKPPATASGRVVKNPSTKVSRFAGDAPRIRKLALDHYELSIEQLKEKYNLAPSTETIRQILIGKIFPDANYDPKEWIEMHSRKKA